MFIDRRTNSMLGAGFQLTRGRHGDDPLHTWAKARRSNQRIDQLRRAQSDVSNGPSSAPSKPNNHNDSSPHKQHKLLPNLVASDPSASSSSNLDRFLESVTPSVPAQFLSKVSFNQHVKLYFSFFLWHLVDDDNLCVDDIAMGKKSR